MIHVFIIRMAEDTHLSIQKQFTIKFEKIRREFLFATDFSLSYNWILQRSCTDIYHEIPCFSHRFCRETTWDRTCQFAIGYRKCPLCVDTCLIVFGTDCQRTVIPKLRCSNGMPMNIKISLIQKQNPSYLFRFAA